MKRVIIIMAKVPRAGNVKTRLQPFLSPEQCRALAEAFLLDAINKTRKHCDALIIAFTPAPEKDYFPALNLKKLILIEQQGEALGDKMFNAFEFAAEKFSDANVVMIGTDSPTFPAEFIEKAFAFLEQEAGTVLGKAADGGFYLIGLQKLFPGIFENIEWSSALVYDQIKRNLKKQRIKLQTVSDWYDVDTPEDLQKLYEESLIAERMPHIAPSTYQWLLSNAGIFNGKI